MGEQLADALLDGPRRCVERLLGLEAGTISARPVREWVLMTPR
jgi:hypothetical protein